ncbi:MAG: transporter substrate-binding domain-containing protein [Actinomycetota bacterium]|nr:transporter substrate-binding domain-containing protein [Actinomycetota bacterium]
MTRFRLVLLIIPVFAMLLFAGCASDDSSSDDTSTDATTTASSCAPEDLDTFKDGVLTIATDSPAYPPYFEDDDPTNGKGFEGALGYAIADQLGFNRSEVEWAVVPFNVSFAPGDKKFDFDLNQISILPKRAENVDFSTPYYTASQGVLVPKGSDFDGITSLDELKDATIGVQLGTTAYDAVEEQIDPSNEPKVFDNSNDVVTAFKQEQVDAIVVDLPQAIYLRDAGEVTNAVVAGQFEAPGGDEWGALLAKDSSLTSCVDEAITALEEDGTLAEITKQWMSESANAPELQ